MTDGEFMELFSKFVLVGSIILIIYIIYFELKSARIREEIARIKLGEKENEDLVDNLSQSELVDFANKSESDLPAAPAAPDKTDPKK